MKKYCSTCGASVGNGLSYCNQCGVKLLDDRAADSGQPAELSPDSLIWAMVSVFIAGLGVIIGLMAVMKEVLNFNEGLIISFTSLSFLMWFIIEGVLIWLMLRNRGGNRPAIDASLLEELREARSRALPAPLPSVTEHTTRSMEPAYRERNTE
jgi:hypothetical protein